MKLYSHRAWGPGDAQDHHRPGPAQALEESQVVCGYTVYLDLIRAQFPGKEIITTPHDAGRWSGAAWRWRQAAQGKTTWPWCAPATPASTAWRACCYEVAQDYDRPWRSRWCPASRRPCSGAAVLGAPLIHDFAVISLSDLLTPWEKIETPAGPARPRRISCSASTTPAASGRADYLQRACDILLRHQSPGHRVRLRCATSAGQGQQGQVT